MSALPSSLPILLAVVIIISPLEVCRHLSVDFATLLLKVADTSHATPGTLSLSFLHRHRYHQAALGVVGGQSDLAASPDWALAPCDPSRAALFIITAFSYEESGVGVFVFVNSASLFRQTADHQRSCLLNIAQRASPSINHHL